MKTDVLFAGVATTDLPRALPWYAALLGRPADIVVHDGEVMWKVADAGWLNLFADGAMAGGAVVTVAVPDLDAALAEIAGRGLARPAVETIPGARRKAPFVDADGNTITLIEVVARDNEGGGS
ncbi:MAG: VOC family protein [Acidimicrobiales bacterium]